MRLLNFIGTAFALMAVGACCPPPAVRGPCTIVTLEQNGVPAVAVAEASVRSPDITLPLTPASRQALLDYLAQGGRRESENEDFSIADAGEQYAGLMDALANQETLDIEDLESQTYATWFKTKPLTQVIDAREARPTEPGSVRAVSDGRFWWIFRRVGAKKFDRLVVFSALGDNK